MGMLLMGYNAVSLMVASIILRRCPASLMWPAGTRRRDARVLLAVRQSWAVARPGGIAVVWIGFHASEHI